MLVLLPRIVLRIFAGVLLLSDLRVEVSARAVYHGCFDGIHMDSTGLLGEARRDHAETMREFSIESFNNKRSAGDRPTKKHACDRENDE